MCVRIMRKRLGAAWLILLVPVLLLGGVAFDAWRAASLVPPGLALVPQKQVAFVVTDRVDMFSARAADHQAVLNWVLEQHFADMEGWESPIACASIPDSSNLSDIGVDPTGPAAALVVDDQLALVLPASNHELLRNALIGPIWSSHSAEPECEDIVVEQTSQPVPVIGEIGKIAVVAGQPLCFGLASSRLAIVVFGRTYETNEDACTQPPIVELASDVTDPGNLDRFAADDGFRAALERMKGMEPTEGDSGMWAVLPDTTLNAADTVLIKAVLRPDAVDASAFVPLKTRAGSMLDSITRVVDEVEPFPVLPGTLARATFRDPRLSGYFRREAALRNDDPLNPGEPLEDSSIFRTLVVAADALRQAVSRPGTSVEQIHYAVAPDAYGLPGLLLQVDLATAPAATRFLDDVISILAENTRDDASAFGCADSGMVPHADRSRSDSGTSASGNATRCAGMIYLTPMLSEQAISKFGDELGDQFDEEGIRNSDYRWVGQVQGRRVTVASSLGVYTSAFTLEGPEDMNHSKVHVEVATSQLDLQYAAYPPELRDYLVRIIDPDVLFGYPRLDITVDPAALSTGLDLRLRLSRK